MNRSHLLAVSALAIGCASPASHADDLTGTAYVVIYKTDPPSSVPNRSYVPGVTRRPPNGGPGGTPAYGARTTLSLYDSARGRELAKASYDTQLGGYLFRLPMQVDSGRDNKVCLVLKGVDRVSIPVRDERAGDDGYAFQNPLWQAELLRAGELASARKDFAALRSRLDEEDREYAGLGAEAASPPSVCGLGPPQVEPPRAAAAMSPADATAMAGPVCANKWAARLGTMADSARLYRDARLDADWQARASGEAAAQALPELVLQIGTNELQLIVDAANKGSVFLQHADGIARFSATTQACKASFTNLAAKALAQWETQRDQARMAPEMAKRNCESRVARADQIRRGKAAAVDYQRALEKHIGELERGEPPATASTRLDRLACKES